MMGDRASELFDLIRAARDRQDEVAADTERRIATLEAEIARLRRLPGDLTSLDEQLRVARVGCDRLEAQRAEAARALDGEAQSLRDRMTRALDDLGKRHRVQLDRGRSGRLQATLRSMAEAFSGELAHQGVTAAQATLAQLRAAVSSLATRCDGLRSALHAHATRCADSLSVLSTEEAEVRRLRDQLGALKTEWRERAARIARDHGRGKPLPLVETLAAADRRTAHRLRNEVFGRLLAQARQERSAGLSGPDPLDGLARRFET